ncbi:MAG: hypothetical protein K1X28_00605 [Parachlamydiales bacterium]|nr:hypothetical protein [Parachlamydiales bacterium]
MTSSINDIHPSFQVIDSEPPKLTEWQERVKEISKWVATGLIFAAAIAIAGLAALLSLHAGGLVGVFVVSALISGFAFATAFVVHTKAMKFIDDYFDKSVAVGVPAAAG